MPDKVLARVSIEPSESACLGSFHVVHRQAGEYFTDVQSGQSSGHFRRCCGCEKGWRGVEAVIDLGMIEELDVAARVS
ncbi:hypothetical protein DFP74_5049 [Nocardiopsis sp. Huas11]|nr:hypothetical protein DFP74_5049 [Nocardiopsis sp. Huas11]